MHWAAARNVHCSQLVEESMLAPYPTSGNAVDSGVQEGEQAICLEVATARIQGKCLSINFY